MQVAQSPLAMIRRLSISMSDVAQYGLMPSPLIPIEAPLDLRRLLDSLQTAEADCQRIGQTQETGSTETTAPVASKASMRRRRPQTQKSGDDLPFFH